MHIVTAAHDFYPDPGSGGTGRYVYETARRLVDRGHHVSVITRRRGDRPSRSVIDGVTVYRYDLHIADRSAPAVFAQLPQAWRDVGDHVDDLSGRAPPDLLSAQGPVTSLLVGQQFEADVPRVVTFHSPWPVEYRIRTRHDRAPSRRRLNATLRRQLERGLLSRSDGVITLSEFMGDELQRVYDLDVNPAVIPGGVDAERFSPMAASGDRSFRGDPSFLTVRRLAERMGHPLLLEAFANVVEQWPDARLYIASDGPERDRLEQLATSLGVGDRTTFLGFVPDRDLSAVYAAADVFVLPTTELEGFGLATLEALAAGTPVVATPVGGTIEVLSGLTEDLTVPAKLVVSAVSADALTEGMLAWADLSAQAIAAAGVAGRQYARSCFSWEQTVAAVDAYYEQIVGDPSRTLSTSQWRNGATADCSGSR